jgi:hypothetical protein
MLLVIFIYAVTFCLQLLVLAKTFDIRTNRLTLSPPFWFVLGFILFVFIPHGFIFFSPSTESYYVTFIQGETYTSILACCLFAAAYSFLLLFQIPRLQLESRLFALSKVSSDTGTGILIGLFLFFGLLFHIYLYGFSANVSTELLKGLLTGNFHVLFDSYNELRYAATKQQLLENGLRGVGTVTNLSEFCLYSAVGLCFLRQQCRRLPSSMILTAFACALAFYATFASGARAKILSLGIYVVVVLLLVKPRNNIKIPLYGFSLAAALVVTITMLTPKANVGSGGIFSIVQRFSGNAINDAIIIETQESGTYQFRSGFASSLDPDFIPVDLQLSYLLTGNEKITWYESPTTLALYYLNGGMLGVAIEGLLTGSVLLIVSRWLLSDRREKLLQLTLLPLLSLFFFTMPIASWLNPSFIVSISFVGVVVFLVAKISPTRFEKEVVPAVVQEAL